MNKVKYLIIAIVFLISTKLIIPTFQLINLNIPKENQDLVIIIFGSLAILFSMLSAFSVIREYRCQSFKKTKGDF